MNKCPEWCPCKGCGQLYDVTSDLLMDCPFVEAPDSVRHDFNWRQAEAVARQYKDIRDKALWREKEGPTSLPLAAIWLRDNVDKFRKKAIKQHEQRVAALKSA